MTNKHLFSSFTPPFLLCFFILFLSHNSYSNTQNDFLFSKDHSAPELKNRVEKKKKKKKKKKGSEETEIIDTVFYIEVDVAPEFINGGEPGMENEIMTKLNPYLSNHKSGLYQYIFEYVVNTDGTLSQVEITKKSSVSEELDQIVFDIIKNLKPWKPGEKDGKKVRTKLSRSFVFAIENESRTD